ncbi:MAG: hypothetical protein HZA25_01150 [Candidatus Niyogibacteria bacterium]|nr:hypothetical protein [Candidatus Niyogibacteria bacterium]
MGLAVVVVTWLNVSLALEHWLLIAIGLTIAVLNFWATAYKRAGSAVAESDGSIPPVVN